MGEDDEGRFLGAIVLFRSVVRFYFYEEEDGGGSVEGGSEREINFITVYLSFLVSVFSL